MEKIKRARITTENILDAGVRIAGSIGVGAFLVSWADAQMEDPIHLGSSMLNGAKALLQGHPVNPFVFIPGENIVNFDLKIMTISALFKLPLLVGAAIIEGKEALSRRRGRKRS